MFKGTGGKSLDVLRLSDDALVLAVPSLMPVSSPFTGLLAQFLGFLRRLPVANRVMVLKQFSVADVCFNFIY